MEDIKKMADKYPSFKTAEAQSNDTWKFYKYLIVIGLIFLIVSLPFTYNLVRKVFKLSSVSDDTFSESFPISLPIIHTIVFMVLVLGVSKFLVNPQ